MSALARIARVAAFAAPARDRDAVLGDLLEEHAARRDEGPGADRWLLSQLARSLAPWLAQRWRRFELQPGVAAALAALVAATLGGRAGEALFHAVLELVPLRAAHAPSPGWVAVFVVMRGVFAVGAAAVTFRSLAPRSGSRA